MLESLTKLIKGTQSIAVLISGTLFTIAFIAFIIVVITFIWKRRNGDKGLEQAREMLWWSVVAMFVLMAVWGIVYFLASNLGIGLGGCAPKPSPIPGQPATSECDPTKTTGSVGGVAKKAFGATCSTSAECQSNKCASGKCAMFVVTGQSASNANCASYVGASLRNCTSNANCALSNLGNGGAQSCVPKNTNPNTSSTRPACTNGIRQAAANGDVLSCNKGVVGEPCEQGTCNIGHNCKIDDSSNSQRGVCQRI